MGNEVTEGIDHETEEEICNFAKEMKYQNNPLWKKAVFLLTE